MRAKSLFEAATMRGLIALAVVGIGAAVPATASEAFPLAARPGHSACSDAWREAGICAGGSPIASSRPFDAFPIDLCDAEEPAGCPAADIPPDVGDAGCDDASMG